MEMEAPFDGLLILTIRFKITAEIQITKYMFCVLLCRRGRVYWRFEKHNYVLSFIHCHGICVDIVFSLLIARLMRLAMILPAEVSWKRNKVKDFSEILRNQYLWCSG